ncbi:hypothetical protein O3M35_011819 [Rhynocoris fuscipes]|uniref:Uncharacterized protein n=1 Tax=Rhynocoris fuscipes TaxID=488301 RepID=A0AAW1D3S8_9HEMI
MHQSLFYGSEITISQDFAPEVRQARKFLLPYMKKARECGNFATIKGMKLIVDNKVYTVDELNSLGERAYVQQISENDESEKGSVKSEKSESRSTRTVRSVTRSVAKKEGALAKWMQLDKKKKAEKATTAK